MLFVLKYFLETSSKSILTFRLQSYTYNTKLFLSGPNICARANAQILNSTKPEAWIVISSLDACDSYNKRFARESWSVAKSCQCCPQCSLTRYTCLLTYILIHSSVKSFLIFYNRLEWELIPVTPYIICSCSYRLESWILSTRLFLTRAGYFHHWELFKLSWWTVNEAILTLTLHTNN